MLICTPPLLDVITADLCANPNGLLSILSKSPMYLLLPHISQLPVALAVLRVRWEKKKNGWEQKYKVTAFCYWRDKQIDRRWRNRLKGMPKSLLIWTLITSFILCSKGYSERKLDKETVCLTPITAAFFSYLLTQSPSGFLHPFHAVLNSYNLWAILLLYRERHS